jgi:hypothetical protein
MVIIISITLWLPLQGGRSLLSYSAEQGHSDIASLLLEKGADIETKDEVNANNILFHWLNSGEIFCEGDLRYLMHVPDAEEVVYVATISMPDVSNPLYILQQHLASCNDCYQ